MGLPGYFFIYLCIISYLWLEAPASTLPALFHGAGVGMGLGTGFAGGGTEGTPGQPHDAALSPHPDTLPSDPLQPQQDSWLSLVDKLNVKAFVSLTLAPSVRHGVRQLLFTSGLGEWCLGWARVRVQGGEGEKCHGVWRHLGGQCQS